MNARSSTRQSFDKLVEFIESEPELEVAVASKSKSDSTPIRFAHLALGADVEELFRNTLSIAITDDAQETVVRDFDPLYKPEDHEIERIDLDDVPALKEAVQSLGDLSQTPSFAPGDLEFKRALKFSCVVLKSDDESAFFFRRFTAKSELLRKTGVKLMYRDGTYQKVEDSIFLFDEEFDCFVHGGTVFVKRKSNFRTLFDQMAKVYEKAEAAVVALNRKVPIKNFDEFRDACMKQPGMADKAIAVEKSDYFPELTVARLKPVIKLFSLPIQIVTENGVELLVFEKNVEKRWKILKLLDDDYLRSVFTDHKYEVNSKTNTP